MGTVPEHHLYATDDQYYDSPSIDVEYEGPKWLRQINAIPRVLHKYSDSICQSALIGGEPERDSRQGSTDRRDHCALEIIELMGNFVYRPTKPSSQRV